jgi:GR25 family glycosyltransferase involved in LPS biosynthesis
LAGNSAYYITPYGARKMLAMADEFGSWPNDALMCKELLNRSIGVVYPYFTKVQNIKSTTTG